MVSSDRASRIGSGSSSSSSAKSRVLEYKIETVSDDLSDCRLQIIPPDSTKAQWFQERSLSEQDEIVDKLIDARTGRIVWTSHRPVRGWYLHLQLPSLPREKALPLQPVKSNEIGCTPLSLSIGTRLDHSTISLVDTIISHPWTGNTITPDKAPPVDDQFTAISLNHTEDASIPLSETKSHARSSSRTLNQGHARRRSARMSATMPGSRHVSRSSQVEPLQESQEGSEDGKIHGAEINPIHQSKPPLPLNEQPQLCQILLTDDMQARSPQTPRGLRRWAWKSLPDSLRSPLSLDSSKTFSVLWLNAPLSPKANCAVEFIRYEDDAAWWHWKGKQRGRILIQEQAVKALRLDVAFWIAVTLAYLEFLEERDGYHASSDG